MTMVSSRTTTFAGLALLVAVGLLFRLQGVDWDQGQHLHPDERFLTMVAADTRAPGSVAEYFDTSRSPLNPANAGHGFFVYGTLPLFVVKAVAAVTGWSGYDKVHLVGRVCSALFDVGTVLLTFRLAFLLVGPWAALGAAALVTFSVTSIQQAHFFTVDSAATFFVTAALLALVTIRLGGGTKTHLWFGVAFGLALACRPNLVLLGLLYPVAVFHTWWRQGTPLGAMASRAAVVALGAGVVVRVLLPYVFAGPGFFSVTPATGFLESVDRIRMYTTGGTDFPPSVQWIGRTRVLFPGWNLLAWGLGPAWGLASLGAVAWCFFGRPPDSTRERATAGRIVLLWIPLLFVFQAVQFTATARYFLPIVPLLAVAVAWWLTQFRESQRRLRLMGFAGVLVLTALWAVAFTSIYRRPHTRVEASRWIYEHVQPGSTVATEHWDDRLPLPFGDRAPSLYRSRALELYAEEDEEKRRRLLETLDAADVIVVSSNRLYASIPRTPWRYPLARRYYELLFTGELGFALERVFTSYPTLGGFEVDDDRAEEAFTVYDHPKVLIFRKSTEYAPGRAAALLGAVSFSGITRVPPREASALYRRDRPPDIPLPGEDTRRSSVEEDGHGSVGALMRWVLAFEILSLASFALLYPLMGGTADRGYGLAKVVAWLGPGTLAWLLTSYGLASGGATTARVVAVLIVVSGLASAWRFRDALRQCWLSSRSALVAIEAVFLVAFLLFLAVRAFNPAIFWGEKPMDFAILNALGRSAGMPPADPWFAGERLNYFYFGHAVTAAFAQLSGVAPFHAFNLALASVAAMLAVLVCVLAYHVTRRIGVGIATAALVVVAGNLAGIRAFLFARPDHIGFNYFWATSRVIDGTINEYPFWSLVFGDLHAHVLAMPLEATVLYLGVLWVSRRSALEKTRPLVLGVLSAWFIGATAVTSAWSLPTMAGLQLGFLVTAWLSDHPTLRGFARASAAWVAIMVAALAVFRPFWASYAPAALNRGWVTTESARLTDVVTIFGVFLALAFPALATSVLRWARPQASRWLIAAVPLLGAVLLASWRSTTGAFFAGWLVLGAIAWFIDERPAVRIGAGLVAAAAVLGVLSESVFVWDRMNTVFKWYLEMWLLLGSGAALLAWSAHHEWRGARRIALTALFAVATMAGLFTSGTALAGFLREPMARSHVPTLDGMDYLETAAPSELEAFHWLNREVAGIPVVLEAQGPSYQAFGRVSMNTGLPTVLGWEYHQFQQGRSKAQIEQRAADVRDMYDSTDLVLVEGLLRRYRIDLVFVGPLERQTYGAAGLSKFDTSTLVTRVFRNRDVTIYATAGRARTVKTWVDRVPFAPPRLRFDAPLREPRGLAVAPDGTVAIADFGNRRVQRLGPDLLPIAAFGTEGTGAGEFRDPCGIAIDTQGHIWVADTWNHRIVEFAPDGRPLRELRADLYGPRGIASALDGSVYVTDTGNHRVVRFTPGGKSRVVVDRTSLDNPVGVAVNAHGEIVVADVGHRRMAVFNADGQAVREWTVAWRPDPRLEPYLAVGPDDVVWVTDPAGQQVLLFDRAGRALGTAAASAPLVLPLGIAIVNRDTALVADAATGRVIEVRRRPRGAQPGGGAGGAAGSAAPGSTKTMRLQTPTRNSPAR